MHASCGNAPFTPPLGKEQADSDLRVVMYHSGFVLSGCMTSKSPGHAPPWPPHTGAKVKWAVDRQHACMHRTKQQRGHMSNSIQPRNCRVTLAPTPSVHCCSKVLQYKPTSPMAPPVLQISCTPYLLLQQRAAAASSPHCTSPACACAHACDVMRHIPRRMAKAHQQGSKSSTCHISSTQQHTQQ